MSRLRNRTRPEPLAPARFTLDGYSFEIINRDLWAVLPGAERIDRVKVTRSSVSRSASAGYPARLVWPRNVTDHPLEDLLEMAAFWIAWRGTDEWSRHPEVGIGTWERRQEDTAVEAA